MKIILSHEKNDAANRAHIYVPRICTLLGQSLKEVSYTDNDPYNFYAMEL